MILAASESDRNDEDVGDNDLLQRVAESDHEAFRILVRRHTKSMLMTAQRILRSSHEADDIVQESFLKVWSGAHQWRAEGKAQFKTWLRRIVVNLCLDRLRRKVWLPWETAGDPEDESANAYDNVLGSQNAKLLRKSVAKLAPKQRIAVNLFYIEGLSGQETSASMGITVGALEALLVRARRNLKKHLIKNGIQVWGDL